MADDLRAASDVQLTLAVARYREDALAELYRRHGGAVHALARRVLNDDAMAEEVLQEVFVRLWRNPDRFDPDRGALRSYLLAMTHGRAVDIVRSESSRRQREERDARRTAEAGYDLEREVWDLHLSEEVGRVLADLRPEERRPIELAYFGGYSYRQVAEMLGEAEGTVKSRIRSGLSRLRGALSDAGIGVER